MVTTAGIVLLCEQLKACQMEIQRDRAKFDFSASFPPPPRDLPVLSRHGSLMHSPPLLFLSSSTLSPFIFFIHGLHFCIVAFFLLSPGHVDDTTPRSLPEVDARRNTWPQFRRRREHFALPGPRLPTYTVPPTTTPPTNVSLPSACATTTDHVHIRLKRRAAALVDAHTDDGLNAPDAASRLNRNDAGTHSFPPTTMVPHTLLRRDAKPRSSSDAVAVVPRMCPTRDSQAEEITLDTTARPSHEGSRPLSATQNDPRDGSRGLADFSDPQPPEASACSLGEGRGRGGAPLPPRYEHFSQIPNRRRHARAPSAKDAAGIFLTPKPPEASACFPGEECERGGELFARPSTRLRQTATASRASTREGEGVHLRRGHAVTR
ncbi:hypothetical protein GGG16DRAFT_129805 [Schizophyllum commune]